MALKWAKAPIKTEWGNMMVQADVALTKDNTLSLYCEEEMTPLVDTMVWISKEEYEGLLERNRWLDCLEYAGVDNWDGYDIAREYYNEDE